MNFIDLITSREGRRAALKLFLLSCAWFAFKITSGFEYSALYDVLGFGVVGYILGRFDLI
jgi:hypothetical protein